MPSDLNASQALDHISGLLFVVLEHFGKIFFGLLILWFSHNVSVEFDDFGGLQVSRVVRVEEAKEAAAHVLRHLHIILLHEISIFDQLVENFFEIVVIEEASFEHFSFNNVDRVEEDLDCSELLKRNAWVTIAELVVDFTDLCTEPFNATLRQIGQLGTQQIGSRDSIFVVWLERVELVVPQVLPELVLQVEDLRVLDLFFIFKQELDQVLVCVIKVIF